MSLGLKRESKPYVFVWSCLFLLSLRSELLSRGVAVSDVEHPHVVEKVRRSPHLPVRSGRSVA